MAEKKKAEQETPVEETAEEAIEEETTEEAVEISETDALKAEIKEANDKYLRLAAEYDNFRKRTAREKEALFGDAQAAAVAAFLEVYDNMERAIATPSSDESYKKGVEIIFSELCKALEKLKVETVSPEGEPFDPNFHNAVMHEENENFGENTVSEVFQKGMKLGNRVIRPAIVKVAN